ACASPCLQRESRFAAGPSWGSELSHFYASRVAVPAPRQRCDDLCENRPEADANTALIGGEKPVKSSIALVAGFAALFSLGAYGADACKHRGELDAMYCDENNDMVADSPADPKKWKNPSTIVFTYTPVEDPAVYENV